MPSTIYSDSPYGCTIYVPPTGPAITQDVLNHAASFTNGGTIPFYIRFQYQWSNIETSQGVFNWGALDTSIDAINNVPGLRVFLPIQGAPKFWCSLDANGNSVAYGSSTAVLPNATDFASFAARVAQRYGDSITIYQIGNEEWDTYNRTGSLLGPVAAAAYPAIRQYTSSPIDVCAVRKIPIGSGKHVQMWMQNFWTSGGKADAVDLHFYRNGTTINNVNAADPTTSDNDANALANNLTALAIQQEIALIQGVLATYAPSGTQLWITETGWALPPATAQGTTQAQYSSPHQQSQYIQDMYRIAEMSGVSRVLFYVMDNSNDYTSIDTLATSTDLATYISNRPQWTAGPNSSAPVISIDALTFSGTNASAPTLQYMSVGNPTAATQSWSVSSNQSWLSATSYSGAVTSGSLASLGRTTMAVSVSIGALSPGTYTGTLTYTVGTLTGTTTVTLIVIDPADSSQGLTLTANSLTFTGTAGGSNPAAQSFTFTNNDTYPAYWSAYTEAAWVSLSSSSGTLAASSNQSITVSVSTIGLSPGSYRAIVPVTVATTPATTTSIVDPTTPGAVSTTAKFVILLTINAASSPCLQLSASTLPLAATAGSNTLVQDTMSITNCRSSSDNWSVTVSSGAASWLSVSVSSGSLPANRSTDSSGKRTDYQNVTVSANAASLTAGTYTGTLTYSIGTGSPATATTAVTLTVTSGSSGDHISVSTATLSFTTPNTSNPAAQTMRITNDGSTSQPWSSTVSAGAASWLSVSPSASGSSLAVGASVTITVSVNNIGAGLSAGSYTGTVTFSLGTSSAKTKVALTVTTSNTVITSSSTIYDVGVYKEQQVLCYAPDGVTFIDVIRDAPLLAGFKETVNAATSQLQVQLPRTFDNLDLAGTPGAKGTIALGNIWKYYLYGPGLPSTGLLRYQGVLDSYQPQIRESGEESVTVTLTPQSSIVADRGIAGQNTVVFGTAGQPTTYIDPAYHFAFWFGQNDPLTGTTYTNPCTLSSNSLTSSGVTTQATYQAQTLGSIWSTVLLMLPPNWFYRFEPDNSTLLSVSPTTPQHIMYIGLHCATPQYRQDQTTRKNVVYLTGATGIQATAIGASVATIGERLLYYNDSRVTDQVTANVLAAGLLAFYDRPTLRTTIRVPDNRGPNSSLGYDIESLRVGDTVQIIDPVSSSVSSLWDVAKWNQNNWDQSLGPLFNQIVPIVAVTYNWDSVDIECGVLQPSQDREIFAIRQRFQDFSML